jgi:nitroimidazol reductase NimA-like FMN-containing flavoprotein (pyridoxamine 5'-phosphate oxidase superfamily)
MRDIDLHSRIELISREDCLRLLRTQEVGRLAFINNNAADVLPVNYAMDGDAIVFTSATGAKLWSAERAPVAFEIDKIDPVTASGWSVVVHGYAQIISPADPPAVLTRLKALPLHPWAGGERPHIVRIVPTSISGRRVGTQVPA